MGQTGSHVEHEHDPFIKQVSRIDPNMTQTCLASTDDLFINGLVISSSQVVTNFATPTLGSILTFKAPCDPKKKQKVLLAHFQYCNQIHDNESIF